MLALPFALAFGARLWVDGLIDDQRTRNDFLRQEISLLDGQIREVRDLEKVRVNILARASVIRHLGSLLDGFVDPLYLLSEAPPGVALDNIHMEPGGLRVVGKACCIEPLVEFTNRLESDPRVHDLDLRRVSAAGSTRLRDFELSAVLRDSGDQNEGGSP
jgi:type IV pilus assembly protein PilN